MHVTYPDSSQVYYTYNDAGQIETVSQEPIDPETMKPEYKLLMHFNGEDGDVETTGPEKRVIFGALENCNLWFMMISCILQRLPLGVNFIRWCSFFQLSVQFFNILVSK